MPGTGDSPAHRVMIIDDDQLTALALMKALRAENLNILAVACGSSALSEIRVNPYPLVFLEIGIADGTGRVVLKEISCSSPSTCIVVMSAGIANGDVEGTLIEGNHYFLPKPFEVLQVRTMANRILSEASRSGKGTASSGEVTRKKRSSVRHPLPVEMTMFPDTPGSYPDTPHPLSARVVDVSFGGMGVKTDFPLPPGQTFLMNREEGKNRGIVRWSMVHENSYRAGIQFTGNDN